MTEPTIGKHDQVLGGLVIQLQAVAMQQLGKIADARTGEVGLDLEGARQTIDILDMLKAKCRTDTPEELLRMLDQSVMDLQLNYMDEMKKAAAGGADDAEETPEESATTDEPAAGDEAADEG